MHGVKRLTAEKRAAKEELVKPRYREFNVSSVADVVLADLGLSTRMGNRNYVELTDERRRRAAARGARAAARGGARRRWRRRQSCDA